MAAPVFFGLALVALFSLAVGVAFNHDEDQFVASAGVLLRQGLLPYRDYPYFHTPNLVGIYAGIFQFTDHLLLAARLCSAFSAWLSGLVLFAFAWGRLANRPAAERTLFSLGVAALFFFNPVTVYTGPKAWNNALPVLFTLLAFVCHCRAPGPRPLAWLFASGVFVSLAAGTRISFAPLALPFLVMAGFAPTNATLPRRLGAVVLCALGMLLGALPTLFLFAAAPAQFLFDNLVYNGRVNAAYRLASGDERSALPAKALFILKVLVNPGNAVLFAAFAWLVLWRGLRGRLWRTDFPLALILALFPFVLIGVFAPTPSYSQYYYVLAALGCLGVAAVLPALPPARRTWKNPAVLLAVAVAISGASTISEYRSVLGLANVAGWIPEKIHAEGVAAKKLLGTGRILSLTPTVALEGGLEIYPPFVTGSFAWRTAPFLSTEDRRRHGFVAEPELPPLLNLHPPVAIMLGYDKKREAPLRAYAQQHGFRRIKLPEKKELWVPPGSPVGR